MIKDDDISGFHYSCILSGDSHEHHCERTRRDARERADATECQESLFGRSLTPQERLRRHQRSLEKAQRELDRERSKLESQENKLISDIKKSAKNGQMVCALEFCSI